MTIELSGRERAVRSAVRNYLYPMTMPEMQAELALSIEAGDAIRTKWVACYIDECINESEG